MFRAWEHCLGQYRTSHTLPVQDVIVHNCRNWKDASINYRLERRFNHDPFIIVLWALKDLSWDPPVNENRSLETCQIVSDMIAWRYQYRKCLPSRLGHYPSTGVHALSKEGHDPQEKQYRQQKNNSDLTTTRHFCDIESLERNERWFRTSRIPWITNGASTSLLHHVLISYVLFFTGSSGLPQPRLMKKESFWVLCICIAIEWWS